MGDLKFKKNVATWREWLDWQPAKEVEGHDKMLTENKKTAIIRATKIRLSCSFFIAPFRLYHLGPV